MKPIATIIWLMLFVVGCSTIGGRLSAPIAPTQPDWVKASLELSQQAQAKLKEGIPIILDVEEGLDRSVYQLSDKPHTNRKVDNWEVDIESCVEAYNKVYAKHGGVHYRLTKVITFGEERAPGGHATHYFELNWALIDPHGRVISVSGFGSGPGASVFSGDLGLRQSEANQAFAIAFFWLILQLNSK